ncbi:MAG: LapA family protein [Thermodesulfobacteriota bacterium]|nr:LapA family protein [Thermodesulfobacteriota bacterium]
MLVLIVAAVQNSILVELSFFTWKFQISLLALIFYSALIGGAIVAVFTLPKLASKFLRVRRLNKEICALKRKTMYLERHYEEGSIDFSILFLPRGNI